MSTTPAPVSLNQTQTETASGASAVAVRKPKKVQKCCFNDPGGPWPRNVMLQAAVCLNMADKMVTLVVGPEETRFTWLHEVLSFHSSFFAGAIKYSCYAESNDNTIHMPEDDPDAVREFLRWVTDHKLGGFGLGSANPSLSPWGYWDLLVDLYIFGDKYNIPRFQNVAINEIISLFVHQFVFPRAATIDKIYKTFLDVVPLRTLVVDMVVRSHANVSALIEGQQRIGDGFHPDFVADLVKCLWHYSSSENGLKVYRQDRKDWSSVSRCIYHVSEVAARSNGRSVLARARESNWS